jgi:cytochrome P450
MSMGICPAVTVCLATRSNRPGDGVNMMAIASIPVASHRLPLLGHAVALLRDPLAFLSSLPAHGDLVRITLGPLPVVVVCDLDLTKHVLRHDRIFDKGGPIFERGRQVAGDGLVTCPHSVHRRHRRLLQPAFRRDRFPGYADTMTKQITAVTDSWSDGQVLDVIGEMQKITSSTIAETLFSSTASEAAQHQIPDDLNTIFDNIFWRMLIPAPVHWLVTLGDRAFYGAIARLRSNLHTIITQRRGEDADRGDVLSAMLNAGSSKIDDQGLTDTEIRNHITTFFGAGTETTATALTWALYFLDCHPNIAHRVHAEVDTVLAGRPARYADLPCLEYTGRVITETLRLRPPAWLFTRIVTEDTELGGYQLPAGTTVAYSPYVLHHRPDLFPDPGRFDPERWGTAESSRAPIPFGDGPRKCIGDVFAVTEATMALATIASRWNLHVLPGQDPRPARSLPVLRPRKLHMCVTNRNGHASRPEQPYNGSLHRKSDP